MDGLRPWMIVNPVEISTWILRCSPSTELQSEVIKLLSEILHKAPDIGLEIPVLLGRPKRTILTESCLASITWSLLTEYGEWPRGVYLFQIESWSPGGQ